MKLTNIDQFVKALAASHLLTADELKAFWMSLPSDKRPKDAESLARLLVDAGKVNDFQAGEVLAARDTPLVLGDYVLVGKIGAGGMGQVFKAEHRVMKRRVAIKLLPPALTADEAAIKRFQREVQAAARLSHPNIVAAFDASAQKGIWYLVLEYVEGRDLSALVKEQGPLPVEQAVNFVLQAAHGLTYAHAEGVVHRDIKPANLLLDKKSVVKILDMGLARFDGGEDGLTGTEQVMGTVDYMSPEQAANTKGVDARADIYSLGCTLWYLLTGKKAYEGETMIARLMAHRESPLPSLVKERDDAPWPLEQVLHKMMAKRPQDRIQTMEEVASALEPYAGGSPSKGGMGSSIGMGSATSPELAAFLNTINKPAGLSTHVPGVSAAARPVPAAHGTGMAPVEVTAALRSPDVGTDPKSEVLPKLPASPAGMSRIPDGRGGRRASPPIKLIAGGIGGLALLVVFGIWVVIRDRDGNEVARVQVPEGGNATVVAAEPPKPAPSATSFFPIRPQLVAMFMNDSPLPPGNYALDFSGSGAVVNMKSIEVDPQGPLTIECWCLLTKNKSDAATLFVGNNKKLWITQKKGDIKPLSLQGNTSDRHFVVSSAAERLPAGRRIHLAGVRDGKQLRFYVDGKKVGEVNGFDGPFQDAKTSFGMGRELPGLIDEARISKSARYTENFTPDARFQPDADAVALYHFEDGAGATLRDSSGNGHHGDIINARWVQADGSPIPPPPAVTPPPPPAGEYALVFDGNGIVEFDDPLPYSTSACTIEAFVTVNGYVPRSMVFAVSNAIGLGLDLGDGRRWRLNHNVTVGHFAVESAEPIPLGRRLHVAGIYDGAEFRLYVDGKFVRKLSLGDRKFVVPRGMPSIGSQFKGAIDELRISKSIRYATDFTPALRHEADADTLALYHFDEGFGKVLGDASGNGRNGRIIGAKWAQADGSPMPAAAATVLSFDGKTSYIELPDVGLSAARPYTIEAWTQCDDSAKPDADAYLFSGEGMHISRLGTEKKWQFYGAQNKNGIGSPKLLSDSPAEMRNWIHVAAVSDGTQRSFYIDGVRQKNSTSNLSDVPAGELLLGALRGANRDPVGFYSGLLREVRISKTARYSANFTPQQHHYPDADTLALYRCGEGVGSILLDSSGNGRHGAIRGAVWAPAGTK